MKNFKVHIEAITLVFLIFFLCADSFAQRKKPNNNVQASGTRLREAEFYFTEGEKFFILEDYAKAMSYYQKTLEISPDNATVHYKIAEVLIQSNKPEDIQKAAFSIDNALRLEKKNKYFYLLGANIYTSLARFDKAAQIYESLISEVKGTEEYLYELAAVYQFWNKYDEALKTYQRAENALGISEISSLQRQKIFLDQGKMKEAIAEGEKLINAFPGEERYIMGFTEVLSQKGLKNEAIQYLEKFLVQNPDAYNTKMLLAAFYRENNMENKARPILLGLFDNQEVDFHSKLLIMGAYNAELNIGRSKNIIDNEKFNFAEKLFTKLLGTASQEANVHVIGGDLYLSGGKFKEAQNQYLKAIESGDLNFEVWENLLFLDAQLNEFDKLITHSDMALELFPNQGIFHFYHGQGQFRAKNYTDAISSLNQAKRLSASNSTLLSEIDGVLGEVFNDLNDFQKSNKAFEDALTNNPQNYTVLKNYSLMLASRKQNLEKAEKMAAQLVKDNPENPVYLDTYSWVLFSREKYHEAKKVIEKAISSGKASATYFERYGDILFQLGEIDAAVVQWEKARGSNANNEILNKKIANRKMYE